MRTSALENIAHKSLLDKMKCRGFSDETILWFQSSFAHNFCLVRQCIFETPSENRKLRSYSGIYISTFIVTAQKMKFSIKDFISKYDQIYSFLRIWSHLLKKSLMENFIFCAVVFLTYN